jgi:hypothetical protein
VITKGDNLDQNQSAIVWKQIDDDTAGLNEKMKDIY